MAVSVSVCFSDVVASIVVRSVVSHWFCVWQVRVLVSRGADASSWFPS